jgi:predicted RNA-binding Zn-ribbon protein involved in translation (DUF1610 family)
MTNTTIRCPQCGEDAVVGLRRAERHHPRAEPSSFTCPNKCVVDDETVRQVLGTADN